MQQSHFPLKKHSCFWATLSLMVSSLMLTACQRGNDLAYSQIMPTIEQTTAVIDSFEGGPAVSQLILTLDKPLAQLVDIRQPDLLQSWQIKTQGQSRKVLAAYNVAAPNFTEKVTYPTRYLNLVLENIYQPERMAYVGNAFRYDVNKFHNLWHENYTLAIDISLSQPGSPPVHLQRNEQLDLSQKSTKRLIPALAQWHYWGEYSGYYQNPLTQQQERLRLQTVAYQPKHLLGDEKNPLIVWLHGQGEGGENAEIAVLGNAVTNLTYPAIQSQFKSGKQTGAYVLVVQTPTYWMDKGDGKQGLGDFSSRYTQILQDTINDYVAQHPDIDKQRIYLIGDSNGGYMTMNMVVHYPEYYAAAVPICAAYPYYHYNQQGQERRNQVFFDQAKVMAAKNTPLWFVNASNDKVVKPQSYSQAIFQRLKKAGMQNLFYSNYPEVRGTEFNAEYLGHFSWIYVLNNQVKKVSPANLQPEERQSFPQDSLNQQINPQQKDFPYYVGGLQQARYQGNSYNSLFEWLNAQRKP